MTDEERWGANQRFLDEGIESGDDFILVTPAGRAKPPRYFYKELQYLASRGYWPTDDQLRLVRNKEQ